MSSPCLLLQQPALRMPPCPHMLDASRREQRAAAGADGSQASLWRPWLSSSNGASRKPATPYTRLTARGTFTPTGKSQAFQHPVRLFWPKSQSFDYLYSDGEALLRNFPVQATISFYEDSASEDEEDEEEDFDSEECLKQ